MSRLMLAGWNELQWATVGERIPINPESMNSLLEARLLWLKSCDGPPKEGAENHELTAGLMMNINTYMTNCSDSNVSSLDAAHSKAVTKPSVNRSSCYSGGSGGFLMGLAVGTALDA